jgi:hypothetical protein
MKLLPVPNVPGNIGAEKFDNAVRETFSLSKEELLKREAKWKRAQAVAGQMIKVSPCDL